MRSKRPSLGPVSGGGPAFKHHCLQWRSGQYPPCRLARRVVSNQPIPVHTSFAPEGGHIGQSPQREYLNNYFHLLEVACEIDHPFTTRLDRHSFGTDASRNNEPLTEEEIQDVVSDFDQQLERPKKKNTKSLTACSQECSDTAWKPHRP
jgi:hypothetical protein